MNMNSHSQASDSLAHRGEKYEIITLDYLRPYRVEAGETVW